MVPDDAYTTAPSSTVRSHLTLATAEVAARRTPMMESAQLTIRMTVAHPTEQAALEDGFRIGVEWVDRHG